MSQQCWRTTPRMSKLLKTKFTASYPYTTTAWGLLPPTPQQGQPQPPKLQGCSRIPATAPSRPVSSLMRTSKWECCLPPRPLFSLLPTPLLALSPTGMYLWFHPGISTLFNMAKVDSQHDKGLFWSNRLLGICFTLYVQRELSIRIFIVFWFSQSTTWRPKYADHTMNIFWLYVGMNDYLRDIIDRNKDFCTGHIF